MHTDDVSLYTGPKNSYPCLLQTLSAFSTLALDTGENSHTTTVGVPFHIMLVVGRLLPNATSSNTSVSEINATLIKNATLNPKNTALFFVNSLIY